MKLHRIVFCLIVALSLISCDFKEESKEVTKVPVEKTSSQTPTIDSSNQLINTNDSHANQTPDQTPNQANNLINPQYQVSQEVFLKGETAYVAASSALVDYSYSDPVISLPIGASVIVKGTAENQETEETDQTHGGLKVFLGNLLSDPIDEGYPRGNARAELFSHNQPNLAGLLAKYDNTPKEDLNLRKELAEEAVALNPWSSEAHTRLINILNDAGESKRIIEAEADFRHYQEHQPKVAKGEYPTIFFYDGEQITPFATIMNGKIQKPDYASALHRGTFFYVYDKNKKGFTVTTHEISCKSQCPEHIPVKNVGLDGSPTTSGLDGNYATNYPLPERNSVLPIMTTEQKAMLIKTLGASADHYSGEANHDVQSAINSGKIDLMTGQLSSDGRIFLVGSLHLGSAGDEHYSDGYFTSDFVIMEQQKDGSFIRAPAYTPYFAHQYCNISGIIRDVDGDGTDEITTYCNQAVEGPGGDWNGVLQRVNNQWIVAF